MKKRNKIIISLVTIAFIVLVLTTVLLIKNGKKTANIIDKISEKTIDINSIFKSSKYKYENFNFENYLVDSWIQVQGTNIDYPMMTYFFTNDVNDKIVKPDFGFGWVSPFYEYNGNRKVYIGHNMLNVSSKPLLNNSELTDFEELMYFVYYDFAKENLFIKIDEEDQEEIYVIYAVSFFDDIEDDKKSYNDKETINKYINKVRKSSMYDYDIDVNSDDKIITLATCTRFFGSNEKTQFKIDARKIRKNEKVKMFNVKENDNYKIVKNKLYME